MKTKVSGLLVVFLLAASVQPAIATTVTASHSVTFVWSPPLLIPANSTSYGSMNFANMDPAADPLATYCLDLFCSLTPESLINGLIITNATSQPFSFLSLTVSTLAGSLDMDPCISVGSETAPCVYSEQHEVPEPGTLALLGLGMLGLGASRRRHKTG
jgi:hypothetical protein